MPPLKNVSSALLCALYFAALPAGGCKNSEDGKAAEGSSSAGSSTAPSEGEPSGSASAPFDESLEEQPCELLTAKMVSAAFGVPEDKLDKSSYGSSCSYEWSGEGEGLKAELSALDVHEDAKAAASSWEKRTADVSSEEMSQGMDQVEEQIDKDDNVATKQKATGNKAGRALGDTSFSYEDVSGVGAPTKVLTRDGTLYVRKDNLTFELLAYHGPDMPLPDKVTGKAMKEAATAWQKETMPKRKDAGVKLIRAILQSL